MKTILVTGGVGFIGSHLCNFLLKKKNNIICVDNLHTSNLSNIKKLEKFKNFKFIKKNIFSSKLNIKVSEIYHLACPASPKNYQENPVNTIKTNVLGTINMLDLAKKNRAKILLTSTSEVYGDPLEHPQKEDYWGNVNPIGVRSCYDEGKRCAETLFYDYYRQYNLKIKIVRIFNTYGPNMSFNDGRVVSNFIGQCLIGKPITIYGKGLQTRSFCYVDDMVKGIYKMMNSNDKVVGPINLGNPDEHTIIELAKKISQKLNKKSKIIYKALPKDDPIKRKPNINKAKTQLKWLPKVSIDEGLDKTISYFSKLVQ